MMLGDSLAVGVGQARPECVTVAQVGITSERYVTSLMPPGRTTADTVVISLGVNDDDSVDTLANLRDMRARVVGRVVYWLLPGIKERVRDIIRIVAEENGDRLIDTRPQVGRDHLHPSGAGYQVIASRTYGDTRPGEEVALDTPRVQGPYVAAQPRVRVTYSVPPSDLRRRLPASATPSQRIRRLRELRQAEGPGHGAVRMHQVSRHPDRGTPGASRIPTPPTPAAATHAPHHRSVIAACGQASRACNGRARSARG